MPLWTRARATRRAKLAKLAYARDASARRLRSMTSAQSDDMRPPHTYQLVEILPRQSLLSSPLFAISTSAIVEGVGCAVQTSLRNRCSR
ncbi:MAG: hypothetical protein ACOY9B_03265, partial [Pseudomonadota bacterium]